MPPLIRFPCVSCGEKLSVPEKFAGRKGACPNCGTVNRVPVPGETIAAPAPFKPVFVDLPQPATAPADTPVERSALASSVSTTLGDNCTAPPVPARDPGADLDGRPDRWTRGPVKIDPDETESDASTGRLLRLFVEGSAEEDQWVLGHRKQWAVDKRGLPMGVKVGLLAGSVLALIGIVWGFFYLLLKIVIAVNG